jgi:signal transduction histidine kinase
MRKTGYIILFFITFSAVAQKQPELARYRTTSAQLKAWLDYTNKVAEQEDYDRLLAACQKGISIAANDAYYLSRFHFLKGVAYEFSNNQYQKALTEFEQSLYYAKKANHVETHTSALMRLNYIYYSLNETAKRKDLIANIQKIVDTTKSTYVRAILYGSIGEYHLDYSEYEKFIQNQLKAISYKKQLEKSVPNTENIGVSYLQIASAYIKMKQYDKAFEYLKLAEPYIKTSPYISAFSCNYYLQYFAAKQQNDSIHKYYRLIYTHPTPKDSLFLNLSFANQSMAKYYADKTNISKAHQYAQKAVLYGKKSGDDEILMEANAIMGRVLYEKAQYKKAIEVLLQASEKALTYDKENFVNINKNLSQSYAALGQYKEAFHYNEIYSKYNDEMLQESAKQSIANAEARYQNKTKGQEIKNLSAQNTIKNIQIEDAKKQRLYLIAGLILIFIILLLLFRQSRNRKKINQKLQLLNQQLDEANKIKARFFSVLNHDLRSPVSNLIHFLHLQKENPELIDEETALRMQTRIITGAENLLSSMEDILLWSKGQMENFKPHFSRIPATIIFEDTIKHFSAVETVKIFIENHQNALLYTDENYLKTIIRNLTGNAIKALEKQENPTIIWKVWQENNRTYLSVTDNGPGDSPQKFRALYDDSEVIGIQSGLGLHLIRDLAAAIHCEITVNSQLGFGTTFTILFNTSC